MAALPWPASEVRPVLDMIDDAVFILAHASRRFAEANRAGCALLGYSRRELLDLNFTDVVTGSGRSGQAMVTDLVCGEVPEAKRVITFRHRDGSDVPLDCSFCRLDSGPRAFLAIVGCCVGENGGSSDLASRKPACDCLTGLPQRTALHGRLNLLAERARRGGYRFAVLFVDIDSFKQVNDLLGHLAGDGVLRHVAERLVACVRPVDMLTRYGGDEFVVILDNVRSKQEVLGIAGRLSDAVKTPIALDGHRIAISASIGISISTDDCPNPDDLLREADHAMYQAKALGRNGSCVLGRSDDDARVVHV